MRTSLVLIGLVVVGVVALCHALPAQRHSRQKRGFRMNSSNRVAHGFGKRQTDPAPEEDDLFSLLTSSNLMTVRQLQQLMVENPSLTEVVIQKFVDADGDGMLTTEELLGSSAE